MFNIILLGLSHHTASVGLRERIAFCESDILASLEVLHEIPVIKEVMILSTCNRVEILFVTEDAEKAVEAVKRFLADYSKVSVDEFEDSLYMYEDENAVRHVFRVASSLDSMIVGEPQILGQIKEAYQLAVNKSVSGIILNRLLPKTFSVAKRVRNETGIGDKAVSISYAAIELGRKIFNTFEEKKVLLMGAGEMGELAVEHLINNNAGHIYVANRTFERGIALARTFNGTAIRFEEILNYTEQADVIITCTGSPDYLITYQQMKQIMKNRHNRPIFLIDIAVPRDIDPDVNQLPNAYLYNIDDLKNTVNKNLEDRKKEAIKGERIISEAVIRFMGWRDGLEVNPTLIELRTKINAIAEAEVNKTLRSLSDLSDSERETIDKMVKSIINRIMHDPSLFLKTQGVKENGAALINIIRKVFGLDAEKDVDNHH